MPGKAKSVQERAAKGLSGDKSKARAPSGGSTFDCDEYGKYSCIIYWCCMGADWVKS
jgi:hypothetical protein